MGQRIVSKHVKLCDRVVFVTTSNILCIYVFYINSPKGCKFFFKGSLLLHTLYFIGTGETSVSGIARNLLVTTSKRWPFAFGHTVLGGFRTTRNQKNT